MDEVDVLARLPFPNGPVVSVDVEQHLKKKKRCTFGDESVFGELTATSRCSIKNTLHGEDSVAFRIYIAVRLA